LFEDIEKELDNREKTRPKNSSEPRTLWDEISVGTVIIHVCMVTRA
jgi:hypothetical protein